MADSTTAAFSIRLRVRLGNEPGALGHLATAIGSVGGNIWSLEGFEAKKESLDEDVVVNCSSEAHQQQVLDAVRALSDIELLEWEDRTFALHAGGKIDVVSRIAVNDRDDLSMAYTPGVARVCTAIEKDQHLAHELTIRKNTVAIVSDGTAVLGLGDIGPYGAMPVMEGKALLFKEFAGVGAAGVAISKILMNAGVSNIIGVDREGAVYNGRGNLNVAKQCFAENTNPEGRKGSLADIMPGSDVFIGVSGPNLINRQDVLTMAKDPIVFAMANPDPEIRPEEAEGCVAVMATGRSDFPNQINNVLAFPGIFRGALDAGATQITENMKVAAAYAIANAVSAEDLAPDHVIPSVFDKRIAPLVAAAAAEAAVRDGVIRKR